MSCKAIIRLRPTWENGIFDSGHAGITLVDQDGLKKSFDYGHALANEEYKSATSGFAIAASKVTTYGTIASYLTMAAGIAISIEDPSNFFQFVSHTVAAQTAVLYGLAVAPAKATILKSEDGVELPINTEIDITEDQYKQLLERLNSDKSEIYTLAMGNCINYVKQVLRSANINLPRRAINTPNSLQRQISAHCTPS